MYLSVQDTYFDAIFVKRFSIAFVSNVLHYFRKIFCFFLLVNLVYVYKLYLLDFNTGRVEKEALQCSARFRPFDCRFLSVAFLCFFFVQSDVIFLVQCFVFAYKNSFLLVYPLTDFF